MPETPAAILLASIPDRAVSARAELDALLPGEACRQVPEKIGSALEDELDEIESTSKKASRVLGSGANIRTPARVPGP